MFPNTIGRYDIVSELGRGGMATVYLARDPNFQRQVAIKVLPREFLHDPTFRARFEREAHTIAQLEHPAIVPVYDYGEGDGQPFIVMRLMAGGSLADRLRTGPLTLLQAALLFNRLAPGLDKAHERGIIHRDLKPGNILFDEDGHPYISDFGIAKLQQGHTTYTGSATIGTPAYMSPEQARGEKDIDGRSDLYTLGAILFEVLTGKLPYEADTPMGQVVKHITEPVPLVLFANPDLPDDCESVIARAMAKDRAHRYPTAQAFAKALDQVAHGEHLIADAATAPLPLAPRPTAPPLTTPPSRPPVAPNPPTRPPARPTMLWGIAGGILLTLTLLVGLAVTGGVMVLIAMRATPTPTRALQSARETTAAPTHMAEVIPSVAPSVETLLPTQTPAPTPTQTPTPAPTATPSARSISSRNTGQLIIAHTFTGHTKSVTGVAFSPDGQWVASSSYDKTARVWALSDGALVRAVQGSTSTIFSVAYSPDGQTLLVGSNDGTLSFLDARTGNLQGQLTVQALSLAFSPDGTKLAIGTGSGKVWIVRWSDKEKLQVITAHTTFVWGVAFSPDGVQVASASDDGNVSVWNVATGSPVATFPHPDGTLSVVFSPGGTEVITGCRDGGIRVWRVADQQLARSLQVHSSWVSSLAFSEDNSVFASGSYDGTIALWDWAAGTLLSRLPVGASVLNIAFSPDGTRLGAATRDNNVLLWRIAP